MSADERREAAPQVFDTAPEGFVPDTAESYPQEKLWPAVMPSGARALLRKTNIVTLMGRGDIPNPLMAVVGKLFGDEQTAKDAAELSTRAREAGRSIEAQQAWERENLPEDEQVGPDVERDDIGSMIDLIVWAAYAQPKLTTDEPATPGGRVSANGELCLSAIPDDDKMFVFTWVTEDFDGAATFPKAGAGPAGEHDGGTLRAEAERSAGDPEHAGDGVASVLP